MLFTLSGKEAFYAKPRVVGFETPLVDSLYSGQVVHKAL